MRRSLAVFLVTLLNAQFLCMFGYGAVSLVQPLFAQTPIVRFVSSGVDCASDDWLNCPTLTTGSVAAGSDTTGDGSSGNPWQGLCYALAQMASTLGGLQNGAGSVLIARRGAYDTAPCNGLRTATSGGEIAMLSGSGLSGSNRFMFRAYKSGGANNYTLECDPVALPLPGGIYGGEASTCERVMLYRSQPSGSTTSVATMQSATCTNPYTGDTNNSCIGVPTQPECQWYHDHIDPGYGTQYPPPSGLGSCWNGGSGAGYLAQYRSGNTNDVTNPILEWDTGITLTGPHMRYVVWDGIDVNGRGVTKNLMRVGYNYDPILWCNAAGAGTGNTEGNHPANPNADCRMTVSLWEVRNGTWGNATQSCMADQVNENDAHNYPQMIQMKWFQMRLHHCGSPFDTYTYSTFGLMREYYTATYLHGGYAHFGGYAFFNSEFDHSAGDGLGAEGVNLLANSYVHNNTAVHTPAGGYNQGGSRYWNDVFRDNGAVAMRVKTGFQDITFNNTFYNTKVIDNLYPVAGLLQSQSVSDNLYQNNILLGFQSGMITYTTFENSTGNTARNNVFLNQANYDPTDKTDHSFRVGDPSKRPVTDGGGNQLATDPLLTDPGGNNYTLQTGSPAIAAGHTACLSYTAPVWGSGIGDGSKTGQPVWAYDIDFSCQNDIAGNSRGSTPDMGAFQFGSGAGSQPVNTVIDTGQANGSMTISTSVTFTYHGTGGTGTGYTYECQIDGGGYSACNSGTKSYTSLTVGSHTFMVKATDDGAEADATPTSRTWEIVEELPPNTSITACPSNGTATSVSIAFTNSGCIGTCTDQCELDGGGYGTCTTPKAYSGLSVGDHNFSVRAVDGGTGLTDPTPATCTWTQTAPGGGSFSVGSCIEVIVTSLNIRLEWPPSTDILGQQHLGARGLIVATNATTSGGFTGIHVDYYSGDPATTPGGNVPASDLDGWHSTNTGNINGDGITCPSATNPPKLGGGTNIGIGARFGG